MQVLTRLLTDNLEQFGEYPMLYEGDKVYTNREILEQALALRNRFIAAGVQPGDRILVSMPNRTEVYVAYQAALMAGAIVVPVMYLLGIPEFEHILRDADPKVVVGDSSTADKLREAKNRANVQAQLWSADDGQPGFEPLFGTAPAPDPASLPTVHEDDVAVILYTSGTTGTPKGVMLTHKNLYSNARQTAGAGDNTERTVTLGVLPLAHIYGFTVTTINAMTGGSIVVFRKFDAEEVFRAIERHRVRTFAAVPAMLYAMVTHPAADHYDLSSLEAVSSGSAPCPVTLIEAFRQKFGAEVLEGYGLSEAAPIVSGHRPGMPIKPGTVGVLVPGVEARIVDDEGHDVPTGQVGELWVRGDNVTPGYYRNPEATNEALREGGWLATGDMAKMDEDGYLTIVERKKDLIIRGGFNIYPRDVEEVLLTHPDVAQAAVVGVSSERLGEEVVAFVVPKPGHQVVEEDVLRHAGSILARYKTPRQIFVVDALPVNTVGKVMKRTLRAWAEERIHQQAAGSGNS
jgi:long-chain acyl-CoA synthetase